MEKPSPENKGASELPRVSASFRFKKPVFLKLSQQTKAKVCIFLEVCPIQLLESWDSLAKFHQHLSHRFPDII